MGSMVVDKTFREIVWGQFGASIDMLENAMRACPETVWGDRSRSPEFWYVAFHTLFYLDLYLSESDTGFSPPAPFTLDELDERGLMPDRVYTKEELLKYLAHGREKCRLTILALTEREQTGVRVSNGSISVLQKFFSTTCGMSSIMPPSWNLLLRQKIDSAPRWVRRTGMKLGSESNDSGRGNDTRPLSISPAMVHGKMNLYRRGH